MRTLLTVLSFATSALSQNCTRALLKTITQDYASALKAGTPSFSSLSPGTLTYTENRASSDIKTGILSKGLKIDFERHQHDIVQCAGFLEAIVQNPSAPYVIHSQLRLDTSTQKVNQIDSIITTKGDWLFNVTGTYYWASREKWDPIPAEKQDTRQVIKAAGDAYCDLFNDKNVKVPWGTPCARLEGGAYTGKGAANDRCDVGVPNGVKLVNRQYVIDQEYGTVDIIMDFGGTDGSVGTKGLPDSHEFRVEGGKLRYVHTLSSCGKRPCMG
ncbi:hypothetical protein BU24DRAFT_422098 [Aaosphaeria arxii CBS 175.79]|uniref:DUF8021 domain-containing protein n=1 Tax=Aaosphaeria arxii CBS 175.79 TaxID=1450172 RepID=A0A6A5XS92_9PLEO|nr:uncharacterized protein BU24DRAFT_422098 [Aaosphaeria arxii CBS 175.79]KAF2015779.1 hypothetical protein BU24DRAFT_422098 [Aaosphaeria arxii CBS 175.79]